MQRPLHDVGLQLEPVLQAVLLSVRRHRFLEGLSRQQSRPVPLRRVRALLSFDPRPLAGLLELDQRQARGRCGR